MEYDNLQLIPIEKSSTSFKFLRYWLFKFKGQEFKSPEHFFHVINT